MRHFLIILIQFIPLWAVSQKIQYSAVPLSSPDSIQIARLLKADCGVSCRDKANSILSVLHEAGYLEAMLSVVPQGRDTLYRISPGGLYKILQMDISQIPDSISAIYKNQLQRGQPYRNALLSEIQERTVMAFNKRGYAYASSRMDSLRFNGRFVSGRIKVIQGELTIPLGWQDSRDHYSGKWLESIAQWDEGDFYNEEKVREGILRLERAGITVFRHDLIDTQEGTFISLDTESPEPGQFDGLAGLQYDRFSDKYFLTGYLDLSVPYLGGTGKWLEIDWRRFRQSSQSIDFQAGERTLFKSLFQLGFDFHLLKQDSSFLLRTLSAGLSYPIAKQIIVGSGFSSEFSQLLATGDNEADPETSESSFRGGRLWAQYRKGKNSYLIRADFGEKKLPRNSLFPPSHFENIPELVTQLRVFAIGKKEIALGGPWLLSQNLSVGWVTSGVIYNNDMFRLGGNDSFRGYVDREFFATFYTSLQSEVQLLSGDRSSIFLFFDTGPIRKKEESFWLAGGGAGMQAQAGRKGVFRLSVGAGMRPEERTLFEALVLNIGFVGKF